jgi:hypothetical protein
VKEGKYVPCTLYENRTMKSAEIVLRRGKGMMENDGGSESN